MYRCATYLYVMYTIFIHRTYGWCITSFYCYNQKVNCPSHWMLVLNYYRVTSEMLNHTLTPPCFWTRKRLDQTFLTWVKVNILPLVVTIMYFTWMLYDIHMWMSQPKPNLFAHLLFFLSIFSVALPKLHPSSKYCIVGIMKVWHFLTRNITPKPASHFLYNSLAVLVRPSQD